MAEGDDGMATERDAGEGTKPQPIRGQMGSTMMIGQNVPEEEENPSLLSPPGTDAGTMPNLKWPFSLSHTRLVTGGWARQVTVQELPVSKEIAGVDMRLKPGGIREMHWHKQSEWSFMLAGRARITAVDALGRNFIDDVGEGDLWYFPKGVPHSIQGLEEGCEFLLIFDDGNFSENATFLITDWFNHTPKDVLAKILGVPKHAFADLPKNIAKTRYVFAGKVPPALAKDAAAVKSPAGSVPTSFTYRMLAQEPVRVPGGQVRIVDSINFPVSTTIAAAHVTVDPGGARELHWHPTADEWQYYIRGHARMTVFGAEGKAVTYDYQAGDVGYVPFAMGSYIENTGDGPMEFLEIFRSSRYGDISLRQWMALTPPELVEATLNLSPGTMAALGKKKPLVVSGSVPDKGRRRAVVRRRPAASHVRASEPGEAGGRRSDTRLAALNQLVVNTMSRLDDLSGDDEGGEG